MRCNCWLISSNYSDGGVPSIQISGFGSSLLLGNEGMSSFFARIDYRISVFLIKASFKNKIIVFLRCQ